jgi:hypothetical protein
LPYLAFGFIDHADDYFVFTSFCFDAFLAHCASDSDNTFCVAFTARCGDGCAATAHTCAVE